MARARNIKPAFFTNDQLADVHPLGRLLFIGLWTVADREGRLEDRPRRIKAEVLPYDDVDCDTLLSQLADHGFILRYSVDSKRFIQVLKFNKHQNPHMKEASSSIPAPDLTGASTVQSPNKNGTSPADSLNPLTDTGYLNADCGGTANADAQAQAPAKPKAKRNTQVPEDFAVTEQMEAWGASQEPPFSVSAMRVEIPQFVDYYRGKGEKRADWNRSFYTWMRNSRKFDSRPQPRSSPEESSDKFRTVDELFAQGADDEPTGHSEDFRDSPTSLAGNRPRQSSDSGMDAGPGRNGFRVIASRSG